MNAIMRTFGGSVVLKRWSRNPKELAGNYCTSHRDLPALHKLGTRPGHKLHIVEPNVEADIIVSRPTSLAQAQQFSVLRGEKEATLGDRQSVPRGRWNLGFAKDTAVSRREYAKLAILMNHKQLPIAS